MTDELCNNDQEGGAKTPSACRQAAADWALASFLVVLAKHAWYSTPLTATYIGYKNCIRNTRLFFFSLLFAIERNVVYFEKKVFEMVRPDVGHLLENGRIPVFFGA